MTSQEEHDIWATMECIKAKVENLMAQMETALGSDPVPMLSLRRRTRNSENVWSEYEGLYDRLRVITEEDQDEEDHDEFTAFQDRYSDVHGRA